MMIIIVVVTTPSTVAKSRASISGLPGPGSTKSRPETDQRVFSKTPPHYFLPRIASLAALATRNFTTFFAGILMA